MILSDRVNWEKLGGLLPVVIQDNATNQVLMLGVYEPAGVAGNREQQKSDLLVSN